MTDKEIYRSYMESKDKLKQIGILADLNCCDVDNIIVVLARSMFPKQTNDVSEILTMKLEQLEHEIKEREEKYKQILTVMEMVNEYEKTTFNT